MLVELAVVDQLEEGFTNPPVLVIARRVERFVIGTVACQRGSVLK